MKLYENAMRSCVILFSVFTLSSCTDDGFTEELQFIPGDSVIYATVNIEVNKMFNGVCFQDSAESDDAIKSPLTVSLLDVLGRELLPSGGYRRLGREHEFTCFSFDLRAGTMIKEIRLRNDGVVHVPPAYWDGHDK